MPAFCLHVKFSGRKVRGSLPKRVEEATADLLSGLSLEFVDMAVSRGGGRLVLRILLDCEGGITVDQCATASRMIGQVLDREEVVEGPYVLEVSSPGLFRPIKRPKDYSRSVGKRVRLSFCEPYEGEEGISGYIVKADDESVTIDSGEELMRFEYVQIAFAKLDPEMPW